MEGAVLLALACVLAFVCAYAVSVGVREELERVRSSAYLQLEVPRGRHASVGSSVFDEANRALDVKTVAAYYVRNGIASFAPVAGRVLRIPPVRKTFEDMARLATGRGWEAFPESLASLFVCGMCLASFASLLLFRSVMTCLLTPVCLVFAAIFSTSYLREKEREALRDQVPDALRCMEACLHAGLSLPQAFAEVASELPRPAKDSFARVSQDLELGYSMNEALTRFHRIAGLPELAFVAMALDVQYACGGSATPILQSAEHAISQGVDLKRSLRIQTAQARLSAQIVSIMPFLLLFALSAVSPGFLDPFFAGSTGLALLAIALAMQCAGVLLVRKGLEVGL